MSWLLYGVTRNSFESFSRNCRIEYAGSCKKISVIIRVAFAFVYFLQNKSKVEIICWILRLFPISVLSTDVIEQFLCKNWLK